MNSKPSDTRASSTETAAIAEIASITGAKIQELLPDGALQRIARGAPITEARAGEMAFVRKSAARVEELLAKCAASAVFVEEGTSIDAGLMAANGVAAVLWVSNGRLAFVKALNAFFVPKRALGFRHPSAVIDPGAEVHPDTYIGPFCQLGRCVLAEGVVLEGRVTLGDGVRVGARTVIDPGVVIGGDGLGFERDEDGRLVKFPHTGGVLIGEDVEIGANVCIDRGTMSDTVIGTGTKIDNLVHIAHNVRVGEHCIIVAGASLSGSVRVGDRSWIGPDCVVKEGTTIGRDAHLSLGCLVTMDVADGVTVLGKGVGYIVDRMTPVRKPPTPGE